MQVQDEDEDGDEDDDEDEDDEDEDDEEEEDEANHKAEPASFLQQLPLSVLSTRSHTEKANNNILVFKPGFPLSLRAIVTTYQRMFEKDRCFMGYPEHLLPSCSCFFFFLFCQ
jgi:TATA-binding protein-associated factor Taf7